MHALVVIAHVDVNAAQPVGLHDCQVLSLLASPDPLRRFLIQPQVLSLISSQIPPRSLDRDVCGLKRPAYVMQVASYIMTMCTPYLLLLSLE